MKKVTLSDAIGLWGLALVCLTSACTGGRIIRRDPPLDRDSPDASAPQDASVPQDASALQDASAPQDARAEVCDPTTQPAPDWMSRGDVCLPSCGLLGGACEASGTCASGRVPVTDGPAYDCDACCVRDPSCVCATGSRSCTTSCGSAGTQTCVGRCRWGACLPPTESCFNGIDDNCDGRVDEGCPICNPRTQPFPDWGVRDGQCRLSCGQLGGGMCPSSGVCPSGWESAGISYDCTTCCKPSPSPACLALIPPHSGATASNWTCTEAMNWRMPASLDGLSARNGHFTAQLTGVGDVVPNRGQVFMLMQFVDTSGNDMNVHMILWDTDGDGTEEMRISHHRWTGPARTLTDRFSGHLMHDFTPDRTYAIDCTWNSTTFRCDVNRDDGVRIGYFSVGLLAPFGDVISATSSQGFTVGNRFYATHTIGTSARVRAVRFSLL